MESFENDNSKFVRELTSTLAFYKLIYVEKLTKDRSLDSFILLGGKAYLDKVLRENGTNISLDIDNFEMLSKFNDLVNTAVCGRVSLSNIIVKDLEHLEWVKETLFDVKLRENVKDTICNSCSKEVYEKIIKPEMTKAELLEEKKKKVINKKKGIN